MIIIFNIHIFITLVVNYIQMIFSLQLSTSLPEIYELISILSIFMNELMKSEMTTYLDTFTSQQSMWQNIRSIENKIYHPLCGLYSMMSSLNIPIPEVHLNLDQLGFHSVIGRLARFQRDYAVLNSIKNNLLALKKIFELLLQF